MYELDFRLTAKHLIDGVQDLGDYLVWRSQGAIRRGRRADED